MTDTRDAGSLRVTWTGVGPGRIRALAEFVEGWVTDGETMTVSVVTVPSQPAFSKRVEERPKPGPALAFTDLKQVSVRSEEQHGGTRAVYVEVRPSRRQPRDYLDLAHYVVNQAVKMGFTASGSSMSISGGCSFPAFYHDQGVKEEYRFVDAIRRYLRSEGCGAKVTATELSRVATSRKSKKGEGGKR